jgi:hypothetical protein
MWLLQVVQRVDLPTVHAGLLRVRLCATIQAVELIELV